MKTQKYIQLALLLVILLSACSGNEPEIEALLHGKTWVLSTYNDTPPIAGRRPTMEFSGDQVSGTTGCNHYGGTYQIEEDSIRFEEIFSTEMACLEPDGLMDQERIYLDLLRVADQFELADGVLTFYTESNPILVFEIQSDEPISTESTSEPDNSVAVEAALTPTSPPVFEPPEGWNPYQVPVTGISVYNPETWIVTGIIEGQFAILRSYVDGIATTLNALG
jgi:heat shock protein HslJ